MVLERRKHGSANEVSGHKREGTYRTPARVSDPGMKCLNIIVDTSTGKHGYSQSAATDTEHGIYMTVPREDSRSDTAKAQLWDRRRCGRGKAPIEGRSNACMSDGQRTNCVLTST